MSVTSGQLYISSHLEYTFQKGGNERETREGGTEKHTRGGRRNANLLARTYRQTDGQTDRGSYRVGAQLKISHQSSFLWIKNHPHLITGIHLVFLFRIPCLGLFCGNSLLQSLKHYEFHT